MEGLMVFTIINGVIAILGIVMALHWYNQYAKKIEENQQLKKQNRYLENKQYINRRV